MVGLLANVCTIRTATDLLIGTQNLYKRTKSYVRRFYSLDQGKYRQ